MAFQEHSWTVTLSLVFQKASYELPIPKSAVSILFFSLCCWIMKDLFACQKNVSSMHIKKGKKKQKTSAATEIWIFCLFQQENTMYITFMLQ